MADRLLGGDRHKLIIVPGNHDINFPRMFSALKEIDYIGADDKKRLELAGLLWEQQSKFRWSWGEFKLYEIDDEPLYEQRLAEFIAFYERFYGTRTYSDDPTHQFDLFDFPEFNLTIAGLNSCFLNDPWHRLRFGRIDRTRTRDFLPFVAVANHVPSVPFSIACVPQYLIEASH